MKYQGLVLLKCIAAFGIVGCHLFLAPMTQAAESLLHFCDLGVAIFGAMSGFFLAMSYAQKEGSCLSALVTHKAKRIFPAYFAWTTVFLLASPIFNFVVRRKSIDPRYCEVGYWVSALFFGGSSTHLWYLAWLFWWSVALYLLWKGHRFFKSAVVLIGLSCISLYICVFVGGSYCDYGLRLFVFMTLGAALYTMRGLWSKVHFTVMLGAAIIVLYAHTALPIHAYVRDFIATLVIIPLFARIRLRDSNIVRMLGDLSFGVYLIHPLLTMFFSILCFRYIGTPTSAIVLIVDWLLVFMTCNILVFALRKCRSVEWIVK